MKKFLIKTLLFFFLAAIIDVMCGFAFDKVRSRAKSGQTYKNEYVNSRCVDEVLILGSSRAVHHYVPKILSDSLGLSCYNAGEEGCGIITAYLRYKMISSRKQPKVVLYELTPSFDIQQDIDGYGKYLGIIRPYATREVVKRVYLDFSDEMERLRILSRMYRNNSKVIRNVKDMLAVAPEIDGYEPLHGKMVSKKEKEAIEMGARKEQPLDEKKTELFEEFINDLKENGVSLICLISPTLYNDSDDEYQPMIEMCKSKGIEVLNNTDIDLFEYDDFQDKMHLNHQGAVKYSKYVANQIKGILF